MSYVPLPSENILFHDSVTVVSDSLSQIKSKLFEKTDSISAFFVVCTTSSSGLPKTAVCAVSAANVNTSNAIKAPLPGTITSIEVTVGQEVKAGDTVLVLEAMKMQNNIEAEKDGKVTAIIVKVGQAVLEDEPMVVIE